MILIIAGAQDGHLRYVCPHLIALGAQFFHFDPQDYPAKYALSAHYDSRGQQSLQLQSLSTNETLLDLQQVGAVWNRARVRAQAAPDVLAEQQWWVAETCSRWLAEVYECLDCLWLPERPASDREPMRASNPARRSGGANTPRQQQASPHNKLHQLRLAGQLGMTIPRTLVTNQPRQLLDFYQACDGQLISKRAIPLATFRNGERRQCFTQEVRPTDLANFQAVRFAPVVFQEKVAKQCELRVTIVGQQVFAAQICSQENPRLGTDWRHYPEFGGERYYQCHQLPPTVQAQCLALCAELGLVYGAIDLILRPDGEYVFLEINPGGQWAWIEEYTGMPIGAAIANFLHAADSAARS